MNLPFTSRQFFEVMTAYNEAVWPIQLVWIVLALLVVGLSVSAGKASNRIIVVILGALWVWMGAVYHWMFFTLINPAAYLFGAGFLLEGMLILFYGFRRPGIEFSIEPNAYGMVGGFFVLYALVLYPMVGNLVGHGYPAQPTFGLPCPGTIFTIGILLWAKPKVSWILLVIPIAWSVIGSSAVRYFGVLEDAMLPVAALLGGALIVLKNRNGRRLIAED